SRKVCPAPGNKLNGQIIGRCKRQSLAAAAGDQVELGLTQIDDSRTSFNKESELLEPLAYLYAKHSLRDCAGHFATKLTMVRREIRSAFDGDVAVQIVCEPGAGAG